MPNYVIHIGPHKTGTTYLQMLFDADSAQLAERRIAYPKFWYANSKNPSHARLFDKLKAGGIAELEQDFNRLNRGGFESVLISSEDLSLLDKDALRSLKSLVGTCPVKIVFFCRRWTELLVSGWQELVKHGSSATFPEFLIPQALNPHGSRAINYSITLDRFAEVFGFGNIVLVSYSHLVDNGENIADFFFQNVLGLREVFLPADKLTRRVNVSLSLAHGEILRVLNSLARVRWGSPKPELGSSFICQRKDLDLSRIERIIAQNVTSITINEYSPSLLALHKEIFLKYKDRLMKRGKDFLLFKPQRREIPYVMPDYMLDPAAGEEFCRLFALLAPAE